MSNIGYNRQLINLINEQQKNTLPVNINVSEWAEKRRKIKPAGERFYEFYDFEKAPYLRWICDMMSPHSSCRMLTVVKGVRQGFTTGGILNSMFYNIDINPCEMMYVSADQKLIDKFSRINLKPAMAESDLIKKIKPMYVNEKNKNKSSGEKSDLMEFYGNGYLALCGANNPNNFRQLPVVYLYLDESATYPIFKEEGWAGNVAKGRTRDAGDKAKIFQVSTATIKGTGFHKDFVDGNLHQWQVPCPLCGAFQYLEFGKTEKHNGKREPVYGIIFDHDDEYRLKSKNIEYMCKDCGGVFSEKHKYNMLKEGDWISDDPLNLEYISAEINSFNCNFFGWKEIIEEFLKAKRSGLAQDLQAVTNLYFGQFFEYKTKQINAQTLMDRPSGYSRSEVPSDVAILTCCFDVQGDRIEGEVKGWGVGYQNFSIELLMFEGDTKLNEVWNKLEDWVINQGYFADLKPLAMLIDSGDGNMMEKVYDFCRMVNAKWNEKMQTQNGILHPLKGQSPHQIKARNYVRKDLENDLWVLNINTYKYKEMIIENIRKEIVEYVNPKTKKKMVEIPENYCNFPGDYPMKYYKQLTSERMVENTNKNGYEDFRWERKGRNELFDTFVYNWALMEYLMNNVYIPMLNRLTKSNSSTYNDVFRYFLNKRKKI